MTGKFPFPAKPLKNGRLLLTELTDNEIPEMFQLLKQDKSVFEFLPFELMENVVEYQEFLAGLGHLLYAIRCNRVLVGMIGFLNFRPEHKSVEIGHIIVSPQYGRQGIGYESALLLINYAIELSHFRIEWKTHHSNLASQSLATKLGFTFEGILRNHMFVKGKHRDSFMFSIISQESAALYQRNKEILASLAV